MTEKKRIVFHLDMDHFYTAIEQREHPELKGKPVIVGADPKEGKGRGVVDTCNYEARKAGVRSAMPISKAWKLCPEAAYLPPSFDLYMKVSSQIMETLRTYADKFEQWGIDEAFLDVTSRVKDYAEAEVLASQIKKDILEKQQLTCSIGIGPNKLVAKIASDFQKPDGFTVVREQEVEEFLAPLSVRKLLWIGKKTERKLNTMGIKTIGDLAHYNPTVLVDELGAAGTQFYVMAHGIDRSEVEERSGVKSMSRDLTFEEDTSDPQLILTAMDSLSADLLEDVLKHSLCFRTVTIRARYEDFETHTHGKSLPHITNRLQDLRKTARELMQPYLKSNKKIRLVGVRVSNFTSTEKQKTLA